ncbi:hypothetical protein N7G274_001652 [Stereocaulon virgatum]|uniref:Uncharacterized protein n=1 Tax=Stereocaulon virgatum TaxID=373712 RepID=A0ABR4AKB4_9LECA
MATRKERTEQKMARGTARSMWVALVEKRKSDVGEAVSDEQAAVNVSYTTRAQSLREGLPPLDLATIKDFLRFIASVSDGIIDDEYKLVTADSLNTFAERFFAGFAQVTGNRIGEEDRRAVCSVSSFRTEIHIPN